MSEFAPRTHIPETWAAQGHCPICRHAPLTLRHTPDAPDQLHCMQCGTACELEQDGPHLRLTHWPAPLTPFLSAAEWRTREEIKAAVEAKLHADAAPKAEPPVPEAPPPTPAVETPPASAVPVPESAPPLPDIKLADDVLERALKLYALGNLPVVIRASLKNSGVEPEQIELAMVEVYERNRQKRKQERERLQWVSALAALAVIVLFAAFVGMGGLRWRPTAPAPTVAPETATQFALWYGTPTVTPMPYNPIIELLNLALPTDVWIANGPTPTPRPTRTPKPTETFGPGTSPPPTATPLPTLSGGLPGWALTLVPPGMTVLDVPTPSVEYGVGPAASACPKTPASAAALFGGKEDYWSYSAETGGWILIVADNPITLAVPSGMRAGYMVIGQTLGMTSVGGPATIHNINFAAITCE